MKGLSVIPKKEQCLIIIYWEKNPDQYSTNQLSLSTQEMGSYNYSSCCSRYWQFAAFPVSCSVMWCKTGVGCTSSGCWLMSEVSLLSRKYEDTFLFFSSLGKFWLFLNWAKASFMKRKRIFCIMKTRDDPRLLTVKVWHSDANWSPLSLFPLLLLVCAGW